MLDWVHKLFYFIMELQTQRGDLYRKKHVNLNTLPSTPRSSEWVSPSDFPITSIPLAYKLQGADKSLARPGRKQPHVSVRMASISFGALHCGEKKTWQLASRCCSNHARPWHYSELLSFLAGLRIYQHSGTFKNGYYTQYGKSLVQNDNSSQKILILDRRYTRWI